MSEKKLRILHICQRDSPDTGGSLRVAEALVGEQRKAGLDARLLFLYGPPAQVAKELGSCTVCLGVDSSRQALKGMIRLAWEIIRLKPDIIHSHDGINWPRLVFMGFRIPVVMHSHLPIESSERFASRLLVRFTTDVIVGISLHTIDTWVAAGFPASKIHYVPNGVDFQRFQSVPEAEKKELAVHLNLPQDKKLVLWVGRLHESVKGTDRVERVAETLPENMTILVVGNGPSYQGMLDRCQKLIAAGKIIMVGSTSTPESYYKVADYFLFTSYREAFGLVIIEAVASGLPLVAFPVTGGGGATTLLAEFNTLMLSDFNTGAELRAAMERLEERRSGITANYEKARKAYALKAVSEQVVDVYKIAMNKGV